MTKPVDHIIDADIRGFFDNMKHKWLMEMLKQKIVDKNFLKLIVRFLKVGVMEESKQWETEKGAPQGGIISPILSNIYLHYILDLRIAKVVKRDMQGYVELIRYCGDFIILVQYKEEAGRILLLLEAVY